MDLIENPTAQEKFMFMLLERVEALEKQVHHVEKKRPECAVKAIEKYTVDHVAYERQHLIDKYKYRSAHSTKMLWYHGIFLVIS